MSTTYQALKERRRQRVIDLLKERLSTRVIHERTGMTPRQILRIKKDLVSSGELCAS